MKRFLAVVSAAVIILLSSITVFSFDIDGVDYGAEWKSTQSETIFEGESNCNVNFALVKWSIDNETNTVYFCFKFIEPDSEDENTNTGVSFFLEDSDVFTVTAGMGPTSYNSDKYSFDGAVCSDSNNGSTCEIKFGMKYGIPSEVKYKVRFIDSQGNSSNVYNLTVENEPPTTEETTEKTTASTTKKTNNEKITKKSNKNTAEDKNNSAELSVSETTKKSSDKTTKKTKKTTKATTTKKPKTTKKKNIITDTTTLVAETNPVVSVSNEFIETENITEPAQSSAYEMTTSDGKKYKIISAIVGGCVLLAIAVLGSKKSKKSTDDDKNPKS